MSATDAATRRSPPHSIARGLRRADRVRASWRPATGCPASPSWRGSTGVSRSSLRAAITMLEEDGFVSRLHGSGTYVTHRPVLRNDLSRNFGVSSMIAAMGLEPGTVGGELRDRARAAAVAEALGIEPGAPVSALRRVRTADGRRVVDATDWCRAGHLVAPSEMRDLGAARSTPRWPSAGWRVDHGVAHLTPRRRRRRGSPSGWACRAAPLLLTLVQVDSTADGDGRAGLARAPPRGRLRVHRLPARARATAAGSSSERPRARRRRRRRLAGHLRAGARRRRRRWWRRAYAPHALVLSAAGLGRAGPARVAGRGRAGAGRGAAGDRRRPPDRASRSAPSSTAWWRPTATASRCGRR